MFQISLRLLMTVVAMVALAIVSLRFASENWRTVVLTVAIAALWASVIVAVVDRGKRQVFAIGFALSMVIYAAIVLLLPRAVYQTANMNPEFNPASGRLPTTRMLASLFTAVAEVKWFDFNTGKEIPDFDPTTRGTSRGAQNVSMRESPSREVFAMIGHLWWAIFLGFCGGWFAQWVYLRRIREADPLASGRA